MNRGFLQRAAGAALVLAILAGATPPAGADIYRQEAADGTLVFTDSPSGPGFRLLARELRRDRQLRQHFTPGRVAPAELEPAIAAAASRYRLEPALIHAVIRAESGYNSGAVSPKGALGLMQLMPATAKSLKVATPLAAAANIDGGSRYLRFLLDSLRGNLPLALAAYNAGLGTVAKYQGIPPYPETRAYVPRVLGFCRERGGC